MELIKQLRQEHVEILRLLNALGLALSNGGSHDELLLDLRELKNVLVAHLELEDKLLYPKLADSKDEKVIELGKDFADEMAGITKVALKYFEKYMKDDVSDLKENKDFKEESLEIKKVVNKRVKIEEEVLYPAYEKENEKNG